MTTYLAAAAGASIAPQLITAVATLAGVAITQFFALKVQKRTSGGEARKQVEAATVELIAAVTDLQRALQLVERWNSWRPRTQVAGMAVLEVIVGNSVGEFGQGMIRAVRGAGDWSDRAEAAILAELSAPTARVMAALARAVLLADQDIVDAAIKVSEALPVVTAAYAETPRIPTKKKMATLQSKRADADAGLQGALSGLIIAARERLHPDPPPRWWIRAGRWSRRLVPGARSRSAITATVPAQRAGDDTAAVTASALALPAARTP
jgi:hypothetical protein